MSIYCVFIHCYLLAMFLTPFLCHCQHAADLLMLTKQEELKPVFFDLETITEFLHTTDDGLCG